MSLLDESVQQALLASRIVGKKNSYSSDNPVESKAVLSFLGGGARPISVATAMGRHLVALEDARRAGYAPPIAPPPSGVIVSRVDFNAPPDFGYTWGIQAGNHGSTDPAHVGSVLDAVYDPSGTGNKVGHMYVPQTSGGRAAEGLVKRTIDPGTTDFFGLSIRVPAGWSTLAQNSGWHTLLSQFNYSNVGDGGPPVSLCIGQTSLELFVLSGKVSLDAGGTANGYEFQASSNAGQRLILTNSLAEQVWIDLIVEVGWSAAWAGHVNGWIKQAGQWAQVVDSQAIFGKPIPTQQWNSQPNAGSSIDINGVDVKTGALAVTCDKSGLYAGPGPAYTVFHRMWVRGTTFGVVAEALA